MSNTETRINRFLAFVMSIALAFGLIAIGGFTLKSSASSRGPDPEASLITVGGLVLYSNDATEMNAQDTQSLKMMGVTYDKASNTVTVGTATMFTAKEATNNELENGSFYTMNMGDLTIQVNRNGDFQDLFISAYEYDTTVTLKGPGKLTFGAIYLDMYGANARLHIANEPTVVIDPQNRCFGYAPAGDELINSYDGLVPSEAIVIDSQNAIQPSNFLTYDGAVEPSLQWDVKNDVTYTLSQEEANEMGLSAEELAEVNKTLQEEKTNLYYVTGLSYTFSPRSEEPSQPTEPTQPAEPAQLRTVDSCNGLWVRWNDADQKWYTYQGDERVLYTGIAQNENGWWYCENGTVDFGCTGIKHNDNGWWRVEGGKVNFDANGIYQNEYGWWKTTNGRVTFQENGIFPNEYGWWKVVNSKVDFDYTGVAKNDYGWWRVKKGKVDFNANGIYSNEYGKWYVKNGKVDFSKNGKVTFNGKKYQVTNGKATRIK